jgi:hypothetical protein
MEKKFIKFVCYLVLLTSTAILFAQETEKLLLRDIIEKINDYKNKTITLNLRFKNIDTNFDNIVFYDRKNTDIIFDIAELKKTTGFKKQKLNLHEGLEYMVTFRITGLTDRKNLLGELGKFQPLILSKIPY